MAHSKCSMNFAFLSVRQPVFLSAICPGTNTPPASILVCDRKEHHHCQNLRIGESPTSRAGKVGGWETQLSGSPTPYRK